MASKKSSTPRRSVYAQIAAKKQNHVTPVGDRRTHRRRTRGDQRRAAIHDATV
jgi:hypothetical protein